MRIVALALLIMLSGRPAAAFDCAGATLPSSIVICGDPVLIELADERQEAINAARGRIGEARWPAFWEDQKAWVRSYATACGVPPDRPPPALVPVSIRECFRQAAVARIAFLRTYDGTVSAPAYPSAATVPAPIGPSFDCNKASSPLALMICADPELARLDLRFNQAYWALFEQLGPAGQPQLKADDLAFLDQVQEQCNVPRTGPLTPDLQRSRSCVGGAYERMRQMWLARLTGPAREEAVRPPEEHLALQRALQALGLLPPGPIDGVYGRSTRTAIAAWQSARGHVATGFLGNAEASAIESQLRGLQDATAAVLAPPGGQTAFVAPPSADAAEVRLKAHGGGFTVAARINDVLTLDFLVDRGASDVQLTPDVVLTLVRTQMLSDEDFIGSETYRLVDGSKVKSQRFLLHKLTVGPYTLSNVVASIGPVDGSLLLGQSFF